MSQSTITPPFLFRNTFLNLLFQQKHLSFLFSLIKLSLSDSYSTLILFPMYYVPEAVKKHRKKWCTSTHKFMPIDGNNDNTL